ncbi:RNA-binding KH domain-containing protein [Striga asiatica]|uniref:RNA-binding KH domain-containing protein n=1 Tax=Striga asiatica TaxID=4170 RepID=A0A5A7PNV1_STRAF|nr:RNA-binding KH domain-containing protein [Striga asiatica]
MREMDRSRSKRYYYDHDYESETLHSRSKPRYGGGGGGHHYAPSHGHHRRSSGGGEGRKMQDPSPMVTTSYRILCHDVKVDGVIGKSGSIIKAIRQQTGAFVNVHELAPGDEERIIEISDARRRDQDSLMRSFSPAQEALMLIHDRIVESEMEGYGHNVGFGEDENGGRVVTRLVVSKMHVGCLMGKGGKIIEQMRIETRTHIRILPRDHNLPRCVAMSEEIVQVVGDVNAVKNAIAVIASRLRESQHRDRGQFSNRLHPPDDFYPADDDFRAHNKRGCSSIERPSFGSRYSGGSRSNSYSTTLADNARNFSGDSIVFRILCPVDKLDSVVSESDGIVDLLRNEIGVNVEGPDDELFPAQEALLHIQNRIVDLVPKKENIITTRLLLQSDEIGSLLEVENIGNANIKILPREELPVGLSGTDKILQIVGEIKAAREALVEVTLRVRGYIYREFHEEVSRTNAPPSSEIEAGKGPVNLMSQSSSAASAPQKAKDVGPPNVEILKQNESERVKEQPSGMNRISVPLVTRSTLEIVISPYVASELAKKSRKLALISELSGANVKLIDDRPEATEKIIQISGSPEQAERAQTKVSISRCNFRLYRVPFSRFYGRLRGLAVDSSSEQRLSSGDLDPNHSLADLEAQLQELFDEVKRMIKLGKEDDAVNLLQANYEAVKEQLDSGARGIEEAAVLDVIALGYMALGDFRTVGSLMNELSEIVISLRDDELFLDIILMHMGSMYHTLENFEFSIHSYRRCKQILERKYGTETPYLGTPLLGMAKVLADSGKATEAIEMYQRVIKILKSSRGKEDEALVLPLCELGNLLVQQGKTSDAECTFSRVVDIYINSYGEKDGRVGMAMCYLAKVKCAEGNANEAIDLYKSAIQIIRDSKTMSLDSEFMMRMRVELAGLLHAVGSGEEGRVLLEECLSITKKSKGNDDPSLVPHLVNLATSYSRFKNYAEAERLLRISLQIMKKNVAPDDPSITFPMLDLAVTLFNLHRDEEAERLTMDVLDLREALDCLVSIQTRMEKDDSLLLGQLKRVLKIQEKAFGSDSEEVCALHVHLLSYLSFNVKNVLSESGFCFITGTQLFAAQKATEIIAFTCYDGHRLKMPFCYVDAHGNKDGDATNSNGGGIKLFYRTYGRGPVKVLMIIGLAGTHDSWNPQIEGLVGTVTPNDDESPDTGDRSGESGGGVSGVEICAFDNRGMGRSSVPKKKSDYSTKIMAKDAIALMDHLGWGKAHVFGHSMGGMIACKFAAMVPERVSSLALSNVTGGGYECIPKMCHAKRLAEKLYPCARMVELNGGHLVSHERTEEVNRALIELIKASQSMVKLHDWTNLSNKSNDCKQPIGVPTPHAAMLRGRNLEINYDSEETARMVRAALSVDKELHPHKVKREMSVSGGQLSVRFEAVEARFLCASYSAFVDVLTLATKTIEEIVH